MSKKQQLSVEEEIEKLVDKLTDDFKTKLVKIVGRHEKKLLRDQASQLKAATKTTQTTSSRNRGRYASEDDDY